MRTVIKEIQVYQFDELPEKGRERAINDEVEFWMETYNPTCPEDHIPEIDKAIAKAEQLQTPWFVGQFIWEDAKEFILCNLRSNEYTADGYVFVE